MKAACDELFIDREFADLIPAPSAEEYQQLEQNLIADGCRDPLVVWDEGKNGNLVLLDGHTRYKICRAHEIDYRCKIMRFESRDAARDWMIKNQLGRRNLPEEQRTYLLGQLYNARKHETPGKPAGTKAGRQNEPISTAAKLAAENKVAESTVKRAGEFAKAVDTVAENAGTEVKTAILNREVKSTDADVKKLAALPAKEQKAAAKEITSGKVSSVKEAVAKVSPKPKKKAGSPGFDEKKIQTPLGQVIRGVDARANAQGGKGRNHSHCMAALNDFTTRYNAWVKAGKEAK
jgi:ParB-like chromosome segregation protein Spo0J